MSGICAKAPKLRGCHEIRHKNCARLTSLTANQGTCLLPQKWKSSTVAAGDWQKARLNIHPCPDPKLSLGDLGPNSNPLVVWDLQNVEAEVTSVMRENSAQCVRCRDIREATFRTTENSAIQCMIVYMG